MLAERGLDVVVLEAAGYYNESDFNQLELPAYEQMFWRGGPTPTADGNVSLVAGTTLGGGTTINWTNCLRTRPWVREQWARARPRGRGRVRLRPAPGRGPGADQRQRQCSDLNGVQQRLRDATEALGWSFETIVRNTDRCYSPDSAGFIGFGDQSGSKQSADRTWLADAQANGARFLTFTGASACSSRAVRRQGSRRSGSPDGASAGSRSGRRAWWSPAARSSRRRCCCAQRSAVPRPATTCASTHPASSAAPTARTTGLVGAPQAGLCDEFADTGEGYGFLIETAQYAPGLIGSATPWISGADHKQRMEQFRFTGNFTR